MGMAAGFVCDALNVLVVMVVLVMIVSVGLIWPWLFELAMSGPIHGPLFVLVSDVWLSSCCILS